MAIISYRINCEECTNSTVVKESRIGDHVWKVKSKIYHKGLCPECNDMVDVDESTDSNRENERVPFEKLSSIGDGGAENLRDEGIVTRKDVKNASDEEILSVAWVGQKGLTSIRQEVQ